MTWEARHKPNGEWFEVKDEGQLKGLVLDGDYDLRVKGEAVK